MARAVGDSSHVDLSDGRRVDLEPPFERMSVREAFRLYADIADAADLAAEDESLYFQIFVDRVEPALARIDRPLFLQEFPASQAALARLSSTDPTVAERFELMIGGIELCNGFVELTDATEQRARFAQELQRRRARGQPTPPTDERFLSALAAGMPPAAGNAVGVDRVIALCLGQARIDQVMAFPRCWL
ncbi:MAG: amino acid--tRNA ligase-related protein [Polyangiaceae bacterium]